MAIALTCLAPGNMAATPELCRIMMKRFLASCVEFKHVSETDCDDILMQFMDFIHQTPKNELENFNKRVIGLTYSFREMWQALPKSLDCSRVCTADFTWTGQYGEGILHQQRNDCGESRSSKFDG